MPPTINSQTRPTGPLKGIWNSQRQERLPYGSMKVADNVIVDNTGTIERRDGFTQQIQFTNATDGFAPDHREYAFVVDNGTLYTVHTDMSVLPVTTGLAEGRYQWAQVEDRTVFAGRQEAGMILGGRTLLPLRIPVPDQIAVQPWTFTFQDELIAGTYQITAVYRHVESGLEGGAPPSIRYQLAAPGGLRIHVPLISGYEADVFSTAVDDTTERYIGTTDSSGYVYFHDAMMQMDEPLEDAQANGSALPYNITALAFHEGSLYAATYDPSTNLGAVLCSEPFFYHIFKPADAELGNIGVSSRVLGMASTKEGLVIATDRAIWLYQDGNITRLANFGAIPGRPVAKDFDGHVSVWTNRGLVTFPDFRNRYQMQDGRAWKLTVPPGTWASNNFLDHQGLKLGVVLSDGAGEPYNVYGAPYGQAV